MSFDGILFKVGMCLGAGAFVTALIGKAVVEALESPKQNQCCEKARCPEHTENEEGGSNG